MEPAPLPAAKEALAPPSRLRCEDGGWRGRARRVIALLVFVVVTGSFAFAAYRARHRPGDLAFVLVAYYLIALLLCCVAKLAQVRLDPAAGEAERRRVGIAVWAVSVALANTFASRVAQAAPGLALKLAVWGVTAVVLGIGLYFLLCRRDGDCRSCDVEHGRGAQADAAGRLPGKALHGLPPEQQV